MSISDRLREAREAAGLSQGQVARKLEMHRPTISEIEAGRRKVSGDELKIFSKLYGVSVEWLVTGTTNNEVADAKVLMAARELSKMNQADLDRLMTTLRMLRKREKS
jgi:transcriptional regulator with XRE-family HTH domain